MRTRMLGLTMVFGVAGCDCIDCNWLPPESGWVQVTAIDPDGLPLMGATVRDWRVVGTTDSLGKITWEVLVEPLQIRVSADSAGLEEEVVEVMPLRNDTVGVVVYLRHPLPPSTRMNGSSAAGW